MVGNDELVCEFCGSTVDVVHTTDPWAEEVQGDYTEHDICDKCWDSFRGDI